VDSIECLIFLAKAEMNRNPGGKTLKIYLVARKEICVAFMHPTFSLSGSLVVLLIKCV
jgi:hypothetical protein